MKATTWAREETEKEDQYQYVHHNKQSAITSSSVHHTNTPTILRGDAPSSWMPGRQEAISRFHTQLLVFPAETIAGRRRECLRACGGVLHFRDDETEYYWRKGRDRQNCNDLHGLEPDDLVRHGLEPRPLLKNSDKKKNSSARFRSDQVKFLPPSLSLIWHSVMQLSLTYMIQYNIES